MVRIAVMVIGAIASVGCDVGEFPGVGGGGGGVDATVTANCEPQQAASGTGHHNPGTSCGVNGCHGATPGSGADVYTVSGTLYSSPEGGSPAAGSTVVFTDAAGLQVKLVAGTNGNFYTTQPVMLPLTPHASRCPTETRMSQKAATGDCNSCHRSGGQAGPMFTP